MCGAQHSAQHAGGAPSMPFGGDHNPAHQLQPGTEAGLCSPLSLNHGRQHPLKDAAGIEQSEQRNWVQSPTLVRKYQESREMHGR